MPRAHFRCRVSSGTTSSRPRRSAAAQKPALLIPTKAAKLIALKLVQGEYANIAAAESALGYPAGYVTKQNVGYWKKKLGGLEQPPLPLLEPRKPT